MADVRAGSALNDSGARALIGWFMLPGALQGSLIYWLGAQAGARSHVVFGALLAFVIVCVSSFHLITSAPRRGASIVCAIALGGVCSGLYGWYFHAFDSERYSGSFSMPFVVVCVLIIVAITLPFYRTVIERAQPANHYPSLFEFSWNQLVVVLIALVFVAIVLAIVALTVGLFGVIGIELGDILWRGDVAWAIAGAAFGLAIGVVRTRESIVHSMRLLLLSLLRTLLPLHFLITAAFLTLLLWHGLDALDTSISVTFLLLAATALALTLCSAAVGDGDPAGQPQRRMIDVISRLLCWVIAALVGLAALALWQRIGQYGLTQTRVAAALLVLIAGLHAVGYCVSALLPRQAALLQQTNVVAAGAAIAVAIAALTPLLDPTRIALANQLSRLHSGAASLEQLDLSWFRFEAGDRGRDALAELRSHADADSAPMRRAFAMLDQASSIHHYRYLLRESNESAWSAAGLAAADNTTFATAADGALDETAVDALYRQLSQIQLIGHHCIDQRARCAIVATGADRALAAIRLRPERAQLIWMQWRQARWRPLAGDAGQHVGAGRRELDTFFAELARGNTTLGPVTVQAIVLGDSILVPGLPQPLPR